MNEDSNVGPFQSPELNGAWETWLAQVHSKPRMRQTRDRLIRCFLAGIISQQFAERGARSSAERYCKSHRWEYGNLPQVAVSLETLLGEWQTHVINLLQLQERRAGASPARLIRAGLAVDIARHLGKDFFSKIPRIAMLLNRWPVSKLLAASIPHLSEVTLAYLVLDEIEAELQMESVTELILERLWPSSPGR